MIQSERIELINEIKNLDQLIKKKEELQALADVDDKAIFMRQLFLSSDEIMQITRIVGEKELCGYVFDGVEIQYPAPPKKPRNYDEYKAHPSGIGKAAAYVFGGLMIFIVFIVAGLILDNTIISQISFVGLAFALVPLLDNKKEKAIAYEEKLEKYNEECKALNELSEKVSYAKNFAKDNITRFEGLYNNHKNEYVKLIDQIDKKINECPVWMPEAYIKDIGILVDILEKGRADSLKEAINIMVQDNQHREILLAQREANRIAQERNNNEARHYREVERIQRDNASRMEQIAKDNARQAEKDRRDAESRGWSQCSHCRYRVNCSNKHNNLGNCGGFAPR